MDISPDTNIFWQWGFFKINATILYSWIVMIVLVVGSRLITRNLSTGPKVSRFQSILETTVEVIKNQISESTSRGIDLILPFVGTLFLFIATANILSIVPVFETPASSLSTTAALAICVFFSVPYFGIRMRGLVDYLKHYIEPSPIMLPFEIISEFTRTFSLAVRLFGNVMSGSLMVGIIISIVPLFVPILLQAFSLLVGLIQAYIFATLSLVYIASAMQVQVQEQEEEEREKSEKSE
jgi:F-type H+-transporting ATPase subunit a